MQLDFAAEVAQKTNNELEDIFRNAKEYNPDFIRLVEDEIVKRNVNIDNIKQVHSQAAQIDKEQLAKGRDGNNLYIILCFLSALFGGLIAIYAGYIYSQSKTKTSDGEEFYSYNNQTRLLGKIMIGLGFVMFSYFIFRRFGWA